MKCYLAAWQCSTCRAGTFSYNSKIRCFVIVTNTKFVCVGDNRLYYIPRPILREANKSQIWSAVESAIYIHVLCKKVLPRGGPTDPSSKFNRHFAHAHHRVPPSKPSDADVTYMHTVSCIVYVSRG